VGGIQHRVLVVEDEVEGLAYARVIVDDEQNGAGCRDRLRPRAFGA